MKASDQTTDLAIVGAGIAGCSLVARLRQLGWHGSIGLLESGRGPGGRAATRRSRGDQALQINHGAPLFNITGQAEGGAAEPLLEALQTGGWIEPFSGSIASLNGVGQVGQADQSDGFIQGTLWQGRGGMDQIAAGLLAIAAELGGATTLLGNTLVAQLLPQPHGWTLLGQGGQVLLRSRWLVLSGTLLAHPRGQQLFGWGDVPLQRAAAALADAQLNQASTAVAAISSSASSNLLLTLPAACAAPWLQHHWRLLQCSTAAEQRWGLRRVSLQPLNDSRLAVVAESSPAFAERHLQVYGSGSAVAQRLGSVPDPRAETAVIDALSQALEAALGLPSAGAKRQLMRWGAAFPQGPGLPAALQLCPNSRIGFCGDYIDVNGFGRIEGAINSALALAEQLLPML